MRQNYFCPNCGTPVTCGARSCMGCGVNFQWVAQSELEQCSPVSYKLPSSDQRDITVPGQTLLDQLPQPENPQEIDSIRSAEKDTAHTGANESQLKAEVSKLLDSFFGNNARCHKV